MADIMCAREDLGNAAPYIPTFYQYCEPIKPCTAAENQLMQQPLSHLYFLTVFEDLLKSKFNLSGLIKTAQNITKQCEGGSVSEEERVLLYIEKQAVVQVMIRAIAQNLDVKDNTKIQAVSMCVREGKGKRTSVMPLTFTLSFKSMYTLCAILHSQHCAVDFQNSKIV